MKKNHPYNYRVDFVEEKIEISKTFAAAAQKANTSAAIQKAKAIHAEYVAEVTYEAGQTAAPHAYIEVEPGSSVEFKDNKLGSEVIGNAETSANVPFITGN